MKWEQTHSAAVDWEIKEIMTDADKPQKDYDVVSIYVANSLKFIERHR